MNRRDLFTYDQLTRSLRGIFALAALVLLCPWDAAEAEPAATAPVIAAAPRWKTSIDAFAAVDHDSALPPGGVVFVGSSSIRLWNDLETQFRGPDASILNRGFGGATMSDCTRYLERVVVPYRPRLVLVYAGDNDLAEGRQPRDVLNQFVSFVEGVRRFLPATRIAYISVKPSPARERLIGKIRETNELILQYVSAGNNLDFIDVFTPMVDSEGHPRRELFRPDSLHLNRAGYTLWKSIIAPHVR